MDGACFSLPCDVFAFAAAVTLFGGFVKGAVGFAMPLVMISPPLRTSTSVPSSVAPGL